MTAPRSRGKPRKRSQTVPASQPLRLQGTWVVYVAFEREASFVINFMVTCTMGNETKVAARLPVLANAILRQQLLRTHDWAWKFAGLPVNPQWHTDTKVLIGDNSAKFRKDYVQQLIANFNAACKQRGLSAKMVLRTAKAANTGAAARAAKKVAAAPAKKAPAKKTAASAKKTAAKKTGSAKKAAPKVTAKKAVRSPRRRHKR